MTKWQNTDVQTAEDLVDKRMEIEDIKGEQARLKKMLKVGFDTKTDGMDKAAKALASNDPKKLAKFYTELANGIRALALTDNLEKFQLFCQGLHITVGASKELHYLKKGKKKEKFQDLYNEYFLDATPSDATVAGNKILTALQALYKAIGEQEEALKEEAEGLTYSCSKRTFSTMARVLQSSRKKDVPLEDVISEVEVKLQEEQQAVDILGNSE